MAQNITRNLSFTIIDTADSNAVINWLESVDTTGTATVYKSHDTITLTPGVVAHPILAAANILPAPASANVRFFAVMTYDSNVAALDRLEFTRDGALLEAREIVSCSFDTAITVTNPDPNFSVTISWLAWIV